MKCWAHSDESNQHIFCRHQNTFWIAISFPMVISNFITPIVFETLVLSMHHIHFIVPPKMDALGWGKTVRNRKTILRKLTSLWMKKSC